MIMVDRVDVVLLSIRVREAWTIDPASWDIAATAGRNKAAMAQKIFSFINNLLMVKI
jgi:hypothetical protein